MRALAFAAFGILAADVNFIFTVKFHKYLPGGYWFLLVSPLIDGLCGGGCDVVLECPAVLLTIFHRFDCSPCQYKCIYRRLYRRHI